MPRKIRQLISNLEIVGFIHMSTRGSHRKYQHITRSITVILSGRTGADALAYQEKDVRRAIETVRKKSQ